MAMKPAYSPAVLSALLDISKSTFYRWEREGIVPEPERDVLNRDTRVYTRDQVHAIVERLAKEQLHRQHDREIDKGEKEKEARERRHQPSQPTSAIPAGKKLRVLLEKRSLHKLVEGNAVGLAELAAYDELLPTTIAKMVQIALEQTTPDSSLFAEILEVACAQSRKLSQ